MKDLYIQLLMMYVTTELKQKLLVLPHLQLHGVKMIAVVLGVLKKHRSISIVPVKLIPLLQLLPIQKVLLQIPLLLIGDVKNQNLNQNLNLRIRNPSLLDFHGIQLLSLQAKICLER
jgi:hypothetical protein